MKTIELREQGDLIDTLYMEDRADLKRHLTMLLDEEVTDAYKQWVDILNPKRISLMGNEYTQSQVESGTDPEEFANQCDAWLYMESMNAWSFMRPNEPRFIGRFITLTLIEEEDEED